MPADDYTVLALLTRLTIALALVACGLAWVVDSNAWSGPVVMTLSATHGLHSNDWVTLGLWAAALFVAVPALGRFDLFGQTRSLAAARA